MTLLSRKADYALLILWYLHRQPAGGNARAIAERFHLSRAFVANILKELAHAGFLTSHRGVKGGYVLRIPADRLTLGELLDAIGEGFRLTLCSPTPHPEVCSLETECPVRGPLADLHRRMAGLLNGVALSELFGPATSDTPAMISLGLVTAVQVAEPATALAD